MTQVDLRLPDEIMDQARTAAREEGASVDQLLSALIAQGLENRRGAAMMRARARRGDPEAALALLGSLPDLPPEPGDELPDEEPAARRSTR